MRAAQFRAYSVAPADIAGLCAAASLAEPVRVQRVAKGEVRAAFRVDLADGSVVILKVFCRDDEPAAMLQEEAVRAYLARHATLPVPGWTYIDPEARWLPYPCLLTEYLDGVDGDEVWPRLNRRDAILLMRRCGATLAALHRISLDSAGTLIAIGVRSAEQWAAYEDRTFELVTANLEWQGWIDRALLEAAREAWELGRWARQAPFEPALLHYDYQLWNLRVDPETLRIVGVIDFQNATIGPAITDLRDLELNLFLERPDLRREFLKGYGTDLREVDVERLRQAALSRALWILAAYCGPTDRIRPATVWALLASANEDAEEWRGD